MNECRLLRNNMHRRFACIGPLYDEDTKADILVPDAGR
jgi:hypothetical protein